MGYKKSPFALKRTKNVALQNVMMQRLFPQFKFYDISTTNKYWIGELESTVSLKKYTVKILYHLKKPKVYILQPELLKKSPHVYGDGSLCLYYPRDRSFNSDMFIAKTIVPWTCEWIYFYEKWVEEGVWWGAEAPHDLKSLKGKKMIGKYDRALKEKQGSVRYSKD